MQPLLPEFAVTCSQTAAVEPLAVARVAAAVARPATGRVAARREMARPRRRAEEWLVVIRRSGVGGVLQLQTQSL